MQDDNLVFFLLVFFLFGYEQDFKRLKLKTFFFCLLEDRASPDVLFTQVPEPLNIALKITKLKWMGFIETNK